jgi:NADH:ubiquinone oxidoreductase subunit K
MTGLAWVNNIALLVHILAVVGIMVLLLMQVKKSPRRIHPGVLHSALTALVAGLVMVGIRTPLHKQNADKWPLLNNAWVGAKFIILLAILVLIYRNFKKSEVKNSIWVALVALTSANIAIAVFR